MPTGRTQPCKEGRNIAPPCAQGGPPLEYARLRRVDTRVCAMAFAEKYDEAGDPIIQHAVIEGFTLASGHTVERARLAYCVFGAGPDKPVVVLHPALTGTPKAW